MIKDVQYTDDLDFSGGDFLVTSSESRHAQDIIYADPGQWKEFPTLGAGAIRYLGSSGNLQQLKRKINIQLTGDGFDVQNISIVNKQIYLTAKRRVRNG